MGIWNDIKGRYKAGSLLMRIIYINIGVFVVLRLLALVGFFFKADTASLITWVEVPSDPMLLLRRPWTLLTYMLSHYDVFHILFNMLWLYWLGRIFLEYFTQKQLGALYVLGGLGGAALFVICYNILPVFDGRQSFLIGASASILAIVIAMAVYSPNYPIGLLFIGQISLKWLAIITVGIILLSTGDGNMGGQIAHVGGIAVGALFGWQMKQGHDITAWLNKTIDSIVSLFKGGMKKPGGVGGPIGGQAFGKSEKKASPKGSSTAKPSQPADGKPTEAEIDIILDKLKRSGYGALTEAEKATLFRASSKKQ